MCSIAVRIAKYELLLRNELVRVSLSTFFPRDFGIKDFTVRSLVAYDHSNLIRIDRGTAVHDDDDDVVVEHSHSLQNGIKNTFSFTKQRYSPWFRFERWAK